MLSLARRPITQNLSCCLFKRFNTTQSLREMVAIAENFAEEKRYKSAQNQYQKIIDAYPNYEGAYNKFFLLQVKTVGPFGLTQDLFDHLQNKYFEAVKKYGEFSETKAPSPK